MIQESFQAGEGKDRIAIFVIENAAGADIENIGKLFLGKIFFLPQERKVVLLLERIRFRILRGESSRIGIPRHQIIEG